MTTTGARSEAPTGDARAPGSRARPEVTTLDLWMVTAFCVVATVGLSGDIGRHLQSGTSLTGDFFASWHLVLYGGVLGLAIWLGRLAWMEGPKVMWASFGPTAAGLFVLGAGGASDFAWHSAFGIEVDIPALLSPPHLTLLLGLVLVVLGPVAALWRQPGHQLSWSSSAIVSLCTVCVVVIVMLFTGYLSVFASDVVVNGYANPMAGTRDLPTEVIHGVATLLWSSLVLTVPWLILRIRWNVRPGMLAATFAIVAASSLVAVQGLASEVISSVLVGGVVIDVFLTVLTRRWDTDRSLVATAITIPVVLWGFLFLSLEIGDRLVWGATLWLGTVAICTMANAALAGILVLARRSGQSLRDTRLGA